MSLEAIALVSMSFAPTAAAVLAVAVALGIDWHLGEPPVWAHPVVGMGRYLGALGRPLTQWPPAAAWLGGMLAWCLGALLVAALALAAQVFIEKVLVIHALRCLFAAGMGMSMGIGMGMGSSKVWLLQMGLEMALQIALQGVLLGIVLKPLLAWRMLRDEVVGVEDALGRSLPEGRARLQRLVSRDVGQLDEAAVRESAIESLAENLNDSLVAPLCWFAVGGLPAVAVYRFANTADAMWGYRGPYEWAGKWAAKADDALSLLPARLTALLLCAACGRWPGWQRMRDQAALTPSPNGGWPMGTMALLLGVALRKPGVYVLHESGRVPQAADTLLALACAGRAVGCAAVLLSGFMLLAAWAIKVTA